MYAQFFINAEYYFKIQNPFIAFKVNNSLNAFHFPLFPISPFSFKISLFLLICFLYQSLIFPL